MKRRNVLASITGVGAGLVAPGRVVAESASRSDVERALSTDEAQQLLRRLGHPAPEDIDHPAFGRRGPYDFRLDDADVVDTDIDGSAYVAVKVPADHGSLIVADYQSAAAAQFHFDDDRSTRARVRQLDGFAGGVRYEPDTSPVVVSTDDGVTYFRKTTAAERDDLEDTVDAKESVENTFAFADSERSSYVVETESRRVVVDAERTMVVEEAPGESDGIGTLADCDDSTFFACGADAATVLVECGAKSGAACYYSAAGGPAAFVAGCGAALVFVCGPAVGLAAVSGACADAVDCV
jgi:hypothetical protein